MQHDGDYQFLKTQQILEEIGVENVSSTDCANVIFLLTL